MHMSRFEKPKPAGPCSFQACLWNHRNPVAVSWHCRLNVFATGAPPVRNGLPFRAVDDTVVVAPAAGSEQVKLAFGFLYACASVEYCELFAGVGMLSPPGRPEPEGGAWSAFVP